MPGEWQQRGFSLYASGGYSRTISWEELQHSSGEFPEVGYLPADKEDLVIFRPFTPPRRIYAHHERIWPGTHPGRTQLGWPSRPRFPTRQRPRLVVSK